METSGQIECSLRAAVQEANAVAGEQTIELPAGVYILDLVAPANVGAASGSLEISDQVRIVGAGPGAIIDGNGTSRVFEILDGVTAHIGGVTIRNGNSQDRGGGLRNAGRLTLSGSTVSGNLALKEGGGISNSGNLTLINTTVQRQRGIHWRRYFQLRMDDDNQQHHQRQPGA